MQRAMVLALVLAGCGADLEFTQANNYTFDGSIAITGVDAVSFTDLTIDWSGLDTDLRGREVTQTPDQIAILGCAESEAEVIERLDTNLLTQENCATAFLYQTSPGETSAVTSDFEIVGNALIPNKDLRDSGPKFTWLFSALNTEGGRDDALMSVFARLSSGEPNATVPLDDASAAFSYTVDLTTAPSIVAPARGTVVDWSSVATDTFGNPFDAQRGDELLIANYDLPDVSGVEADFLRLDSIAAALYRLPVFGVTKADASLAEDDAGNAFTGFTHDGVWLVGVGCTACFNPAPLLLAVVDVR